MAKVFHFQEGPSEENRTWEPHSICCSQACRSLHSSPLPKGKPPPRERDSHKKKEEIPSQPQAKDQQTKEAKSGTINDPSPPASLSVWLKQNRSSSSPKFQNKAQNKSRVV
ncbi:hypothetical protein COCNU_scaffold003371G000010 [Cocos nucifera]|nr:hypothetical protein [Cocos nucifera]